MSGLMAVELQDAVDNDSHVHGTLHVGMLVSDVTTTVSRMATGAGKAHGTGVCRENLRSDNILHDFLAFSEIPHCDSG